MVFKLSRRKLKPETALTQQHLYKNQMCHGSCEEVHRREWDVLNRLTNGGWAKY